MSRVRRAAEFYLRERSCEITISVAAERYGVSYRAVRLWVKRLEAESKQEVVP